MTLLTTRHPRDKTKDCRVQIMTWSFVLYGEFFIWAVPSAAEKRVQCTAKPWYRVASSDLSSSRGDEPTEPALIVSERPHPSHLVSPSFWLQLFKRYPLDSAIGSPIRWIGIYPVDSAIQLLNNWGLVLSRPSPPQRPAWITLRLAITKNKKN